MAKTKRGLNLSKAAATDSPARKTYLFAVGIDTYAHLDDLNNAVRDVEAVSQKLCDYFDCEILDIAPPLFNEEATRSNLGKRFRALVRHFKQKEYTDNLIIYFAGHGEWEEEMEEGYWALHGAQHQDYTTFYSNSELVRSIRALKTHHTFIISDSCFSGGLIDSSRYRANRKEQDRSRFVLASGLKDQKVLDGDTHSPFAEKSKTAPGLCWLLGLKIKRCWTVIRIALLLNPS
jgi:uncharacterized caspase-like protein